MHLHVDMWHSRPPREILVCMWHSQSSEASGELPRTLHLSYISGSQGSGCGFCEWQHACKSLSILRWEDVLSGRNGPGLGVQKASLGLDQLHGPPGVSSPALGATQPGLLTSQRMKVGRASSNRAKDRSWGVWKVGDLGAMRVFFLSGDRGWHLGEASSVLPEVSVSLGVQASAQPLDSPEWRVGRRRESRGWLFM